MVPVMVLVEEPPGPATVNRTGSITTEAASAAARSS
jgi:hypothetical protein